MRIGQLIPPIDPLMNKIETAGPSKLMNSFVKAITVGNVADIPKPYKQVPNHIIVALLLKISSKLAANPAITNSIFSNVFYYKRVDNGTASTLPSDMNAQNNAHRY